jgi:hypothetical protein
MDPIDELSWFLQIWQQRKRLTPTNRYGDPSGHSQSRASSEIYREAREDRQDSLVFFAPLAIFAVPTLCLTLIEKALIRGLGFS